MQKFNLVRKGLTTEFKEATVTVACSDKEVTTNLADFMDFVFLYEKQVGRPVESDWDTTHYEFIMWMLSDNKAEYMASLR